jgi:uncharacterized protein YdgA (DUF945 family)
MKKILISAVLIALVGLGAWSGAGVYAGFQVEKSLMAFLEQLPERSPMRVLDIKHKRGLMVSTGEFTIRYADPQAHGEKRPDLVAAVMHYEVDHHVSWSHSAVFTWQLKPIDAFEQKIKTLFSTDFQVVGQGNIDWHDVLTSDFSAPTLRYEQGSDTLALGPWQGDMLMNGLVFNFIMQSPEIDIKSQDTFLNVKNITFDVNLVDRLNGLGVSKLTIDDLSFPTTKVQGLTFIASSALDQGYLNFEIEKQIKKADFAGQSVTNFDVVFVLNHLNQQSINALSSVLNEAGNFDNLTSEQQKTVQTATQRLIQDGFVVSIPKLQAETERGIIEGDAVFELAAQVANPSGGALSFDAAKQIKANGQLTVARMILPPEYEGLVQMLGLATRSDSGLKSQFSLVDGKLMINGRNIDVNMQLQRLNQAVTAFLVERE